MKKILILFLIAISIGGITAWYLYTKPVANLADVKAAYSLTSEELFNEFDTDENSANNKYLGKIIEVTGEIRELMSDKEGTSVILHTEHPIYSINCGLNADQGDEVTKYKAGDIIKLRGECTGISMDVVLVRSVIIN